MGGNGSIQCLEMGFGILSGGPFQEGWGGLQGLRASAEAVAGARRGLRIHPLEYTVGFGRSLWKGDTEPLALMVGLSPTLAYHQGSSFGIGLRGTVTLVWAGFELRGFATHLQNTRSIPGTDPTKRTRESGVSLQYAWRL